MENERVSLKLIVPGVLVAVALGFVLGNGSIADLFRSEPPQVAKKTEPAKPSADGPKRYQVPVRDTMPTLGAKEALVTIVEWCDLPDPGCAALEPQLQAILKESPEAVKLVWRHYARPQEHSGSARAHQFIAAVHQQSGKLWEARALMLGHQGELTDTDLERIAGQLGLDWPALRKSIDVHDQTSTITADRLFASMFDIHDSPAVFINGRSLGDRPTPAQLQQVFEEEMKHAIKMMVGGVKPADVYAELTKKGAFNKPNLQPR